MTRHRQTLIPPAPGFSRLSALLVLTTSAKSQSLQQQGEPLVAQRLHRKGLPLFDLPKYRHDRTIPVLLPYGRLHNQWSSSRRDGRQTGPGGSFAIVVFDLDDPSDELLQFLSDRHLATLTTLRDNGGPQVTPVGVTYEPETRLARVITWADSFKAKTLASDPGQQVAVCQVDGGRWLTIYGRATVTDQPDAVAEAVTRYAERYRPPKQRDDRVVIEIAVDRIVGRA